MTTKEKIPNSSLLIPNQMNMYNVMIVDDQRSSQKLMEYAILLGNDRYKLIKSFMDADLVLNALRVETPDLILLDVYTEGKENGIVVAEKVKKLYPKIKIIILTYLLQEKHVDAAMKIGCEGFWYKDHSDIDLIEVMDNVMNGHIHYPESHPVVTIGMAKISDFTTKELKVLQGKINGLSTEDICEQLGIKATTLHTHMTNIRNKTGYTSFIQLVADVVDKKFVIMGEK